MKISKRMLKLAGIIKEDVISPTGNKINKRLLELAGIEEQMVAEPATKPITEPRPTTEPPPTKEPTPSEPGKKQSPFTPPKPDLLPKPKAQNYEEDSNPSTREFWENIPEEHPFHQHPVLHEHGKELSKKSYEYTKEKLGEPERNAMETYQRILQIEQAHKEELENLAIDVVAQIWGIEDKSILKPKLEKPAETSETDSPDAPDEEEKAEITPALQQEIYKRITMNTMTQGSAVHAMLSMHHLVDREINDISPELLQLYNEMATGSHNWYWIIDVPQMIEQLSNFEVGNSKVNFEDTDEETGEPKPSVEGIGVVFPVLCQELSKGVMELLTMHGLQGFTRQELAAIYDKADRYIDEPWLIQIGPELWRMFLKAIPEGITLSNLMAEFSKMEPEYVHNVVKKVITNPEEAKDILSRLL